MFKRREPLTILETLRQLFWPRMGWIRSFHYTKHRLIRLSDTTHSIALGLAIGLGVSFTPLLGTHFIQAGIIAWLLRANIFSAMMGTFAGNPWTFPFFWWGGISLGKYLFSLFGIHGGGELPEELNFTILYELITTDPMAVFLPWMLGGYSLILITIPISYPIYYFLIKAAKAAQAKAKALAKHNKKLQKK